MKKRVLTALAVGLCIAANTFAQVPSYVPSNGLVGWWPFNGNANDESGNGNNGTVNGATLTADRFGNIDEAYSFDGINDYIDLSQPFLQGNQNVGSFTVSYWLNLSNLPSSDILTWCQSSYWRSHWNGINPTGEIFFGGENVSGYYGLTLPSGNISVGNWHNVIEIYDGSKLTVYIDDNLILSTPIAFSTLNFSIVVSGNSTGKKLFGCASTQSSGLYAFFNGKLDDFCFWNRALTPCEISNLYHAQSGTSSTQTQEACSSYTWNGNTYTQSGQYTFLTTNAAGCDSTATLNLTIHQPTTSSTSYSACSSYIWNGNTYTQSGQFTFLTTNAAGCDSTATLNLTIHQPTASSTSHTACSSYSWNGNTYAQSGQYTFLTTNAAGCDSTATLHLTINQPSSSTQLQSAIDSYTWPVNGQIYTQSGVYTAVIPNSAGCDSTITLDLTLDFSGLITLGDSYIRLFPNPAHDHLTIDIANFPSLKGYSVKITNNAGQQVFQSAINQAQFYLDLSTWTGNGLYFVYLIDPSGATVTVRKIVLQ